jgi:ABC-2 type transport system permease protein
MTTPSNFAPENPMAPQPNAALPETRPLYWSIRRELWENRSIYIAPVAVAAVVLCGSMISLHGLSHDAPDFAAMTPQQQLVELAMPYSHAFFLVMLTGIIVGLFYSLDALYSERRERSILFWKSLPVSDLTTVLAKASIPFVVLPLVVFVVTVVTHFLMRLLTTASLLIHKESIAPQWQQLPLLQIEVVFFYGLVVTTLWFAPLYAWAMLVSGWARRAAVLWAVLPPLAIAVFEKIAFHTSHCGRWLLSRLVGFAPDAFSFTTPSGETIDPHFIPLTQLTPGRFLSSPGLWIGLVIAVAFMVAAVRLRRYREPM